MVVLKFIGKYHKFEYEILFRGEDVKAQIFFLLAYVSETHFIVFNVCFGSFVCVVVNVCLCCVDHADVEA